MAKIWTPEEVILLKKYWPNKGTSFCVKKINRTKIAILSKAKKLKLKRKRCKFRSNTKAYNCFRRYGITPKDYDSLFEKQKGVCAICKKVELSENQYGVKRLCVDHNHATGKVRGLLCHKCNLMLGYAEDSYCRLISGVYYLVNHNKGDMEGIGGQTKEK